MGSMPPAFSFTPILALLACAPAAFGQSIVRDIQPGSGSSFPRGYVSFRGEVYFSATENVNGTELWKSDGTATGTVIVNPNIAPGVTSASPKELTVCADQLFFVASDPLHGAELWRTDGTLQGTVLVKDILPGPDGSVPHELTAVGDTLFFVASDAGPPHLALDNAELWKSDGTTAGTVLVKDIYPGRLDSAPKELTAVGGRLMFHAFDPNLGYELHESDGTAAGTRVVADLNPGQGSSPLTDFVALGSLLLFNRGLDIFRSDGTAGGTFLVQADWLIYPEHAVLGNDLLYVSNDLIYGLDLWITNGTTTRLVREIRPGFDSADIHGMTEVNGLVYFAANDGVHGKEIWCSDGTALGTSLVVDLNPGPADGAPYGWKAIVHAGTSSHFVFLGDDGRTGAELYVSDGTAGGTRLVADLSRNPASSNPQDLVRAGANLFFRVTDMHGEELWSAPVDLTGASLAEPYGTGCPGSSGITPSIAADQLPTIGNAMFAITLNGAAPSSPALLFIGRRPVPAAWFPCQLAFDVSLVSLPAATDPTGFARYPVPIPPLNGLAGLHSAGQWVVLDIGGALLGLASLSDGLNLVVGR